MKKQWILMNAAMFALILFLTSCALERTSQEKVTLEQVEPSQVIPPNVGQQVGTVEVQGNSQGSFFAQIMNEMVLKLRQNVTGPE